MNIEHLSTSHVNDFIERRAKWYVTRVLGLKTTMGAAAHRGSAVEHGAVHGLVNDCSMDEAVTVALADYDALCADCQPEDAAENRVAIPAMVSELIEALAPYGKPESIQRRIDVRFPLTGEIPWVGFLDLEFPEVIVDIKTKKSTPSSLSGGWRRQGALYSKSTNKPVVFICAVATKFVKVVNMSLTPADVSRGIEELTHAANAMLELIKLPNEVLAHACAPDPDDWLLKDREFRGLAAKVWPYVKEK